MKLASLQATIRKTGRLKLLLTWLVLHIAVSLWGQSSQHNLYLNHEIKFDLLGIEQGLSNEIINLIQDPNGYMWFATLDGLYKYDGYTLTHYQHDPRNPNSPADNSITGLYADTNGLIWVGFGGVGGANSFNPQTGHWKRFAHDPKNPNSLTSGPIHTIQQDHSGIMWFGSLTGGITRFDPQKHVFSHFKHLPKDHSTISHNGVPVLFIDKAGQLWAGTSSGLDLFDPQTNQFHHIRGNGTDTTFLNHTEVHFIYQDAKGLLWLSTFSNGVYVLDPATKTFLTHYKHDPNKPNSLSDNFVPSLTHDNEGNCWLLTGKGLNKLDLQTGEFSVYAHEQYLPGTRDVGHIIRTDQSGLIWLTAVYKGALYFTPKPRKFYRYLNDSQTPFGPEVKEVNYIFKGSGQQIYMTTPTALLAFQPAKKELSLVYSFIKGKDAQLPPPITVACEEKPGVFLIATSGKGMMRFDAHINEITFLEHNPQDSSSLAHNFVDGLIKDRNGVIWVGTRGGVCKGTMLPERNLPIIPSAR